MAIDWKSFFDELVPEKSWKGVQQKVKDKAYDLVVQWIGGDRKTLVAAVKDALADGKLTDKEVIGVLSVVALDWVNNNSELGQSFAKDLLANLRDGELTATEVAEIAANWAATKLTANENLRDLIKAGVNGKLSKDEVKQAIFNWLEQRAGIPGLKDRLERILKSAKPVNLRSVVLIAASYLVAQGHLTKAGTTEEALVKDLVGALDGLGKSTLADALDALAGEDYAKAARLVLDELGLDDDNGIAGLLMKMLLGEDADPAIAEFVAGALKRALKDGIDDKQASALAATLIGIVKGDIELIPAKTESELFRELYKIGSRDYALWVEVRKILYAAKLAVAGGSVVPADAMTRPHVFAAASISPETVIGTLADKKQWPMLLQCIFVFTRTTFGRRPHGEKYLTESPVSANLLADGVDARFLLMDISVNLYP
jgi:hypothetical protein